MVKRYSAHSCSGHDGIDSWTSMEVENDGEWVDYEDYAALAERCERLEGALRECDAVLARLGCDEDNSPRVEARDLLSGSSGGKDG